MTTSHHPHTVVIAASAGGIEALRQLLSRLPADLPSCLLVVLHIPARSGSALASILDRSGPLPCATARDGEPLRPRRVYVAPPDRHLLVEADRIRLSNGPRQNGHRPAADPLFVSAAATAGPRAMGVVLSGTLDDGAAGAAAIERSGGLVAVQDPAQAAYPGMPTAALAATAHAHALPVAAIASLIAVRAHAATAAHSGRPAPAQPGNLAGQPPATDRPPGDRPPGEWSGLTCPQCGGPLHYSAETNPGRFECQVGHGWSRAGLLDGHSSAVEQALWVAALRLDERVRLTQTMAEEAEKRSHRLSAERFRDAAREAQEALATIRGLLEQATVSQVHDDGM